MPELLRLFIFVADSVLRAVLTKGQWIKSSCSVLRQLDYTDDVHVLPPIAYCLRRSQTYQSEHIFQRQRLRKFFVKEVPCLRYEDAAVYKVHGGLFQFLTLTNTKIIPMQ